MINIFLIGIPNALAHRIIKTSNMIFYSTHLKLPEQQPVFAVASKMLKLCKLSLRTAKRKQESYGVFYFIEKSITEGDVVFNIGANEDDYLYIIRRKLGKKGKIIAFENRPYFFRQLAQLKKILRWKNVELEPLMLSDVTGTKTIYNSMNSGYKASSQGAIVVNLNDKRDDCIAGNITIETIDNYCEKNNIHPAFLKIDAGGSELRLLKGASKTLKNDKPKILLKCEERLAGSRNILETFAYLKQLNYKGYFGLDSIQIPVVNFDFNVYQNTCNDFYCNNFMFE
jgi:FkbM family methyltransferase